MVKTKVRVCHQVSGDFMIDIDYKNDIKNIYLKP